MATATIRPAHTRVGDPALAARLTREIEGDVLFGPADRARYSTDASIYQIEPVGVVCPKRHADVKAALAIAREEGISVIPRGGGTSQAGQTVGRSLIVDTSKYLTAIDAPDTEMRTIRVEPGVVLDDLNRRLKPTGLFYPVDISTGSRATIGGMTANNSCGSRSLRYGVSVDNVLEIEAVLADGTAVHAGPVEGSNEPLVADLLGIAGSVADELEARLPKTARRVGGYNLDRMLPGRKPNLASLLVGSEGTLAYFSKIRLQLHPLPRHKLLGVCQFPTFRAAMDAAEAIVALGPTAVELVDRSILDLARSIPAFATLLPRFVRGEPDSLLLVEFAGEDFLELQRGLARLGELMGDLGFPGSIVEAHEPAFQSDIWELRKAGLNIAMSMKGDGKPVSFIEDCAVPLAHLGDYTASLNEIFARHDTSGTWYAHASVGCLHVRPILNLKQEKGVATMRAIAEEAIDLVQRYKGSVSGEHGDGLVRSGHNPTLFGARLTTAFERVKDRFDERGLFNTAPSKIVRAPQMDDRALLRFRPDYAAAPIETGLDWRAWGSFLNAAEMCNNNGACRKSAGGVMCPSFRVTGDERHVTRGRANTLRWALSGQLGPDALQSDDVAAALDLCVGCKGCRRECPTGVDMARMKIEVAHQQRRRHGTKMRDRLIATLPRWAPMLAKAPWLLAARNLAPGLAERLTGFSARRSLPLPKAPFRLAGTAGGEIGAVLFTDCFSRWFEPENAEAATRVLGRAGYGLIDATPAGRRPLCCGRTFLSVGMIDEARAEARRTVEALAPHVAAGRKIIGLEPSCLLTMRDEFEALLPDMDTGPVAEASLMLSEALLERPLDLQPVGASKILVHGHCHEKAFGVAGSVVQALQAIPDAEVSMIESSCCGMAGSFGYEAEHYETSMAMAELSLLPAVREAPDDTIIVADGTSCRHQIRDGSGREAVHLARVLEGALPACA